jgi:hypothetical protein
VNFGRAGIPGILVTNGGSHISTQILRARAAESRLAWIYAIAIPLMLLAPALWNGYPLLQWDTGGYLARWYEGYLVPSRSTTFGVYLHFGEASAFWINLAIQALATLWVLQLTLRVLGMQQPLRLLAISLALALTTSLPWLVSILLTDIFAGLAVLTFYILVVHGERTSTIEKCVLFALTAFAASSHSATLGVLLGLCGIGWIVRPFLLGRISVPGLAQASLSLAAGATALLIANFALSGQLTWTPGGYGVAFGRMMQDGIVGRYLHDHCPQEKLKLCPYRERLPATADQFLWGNSMFNTLGRFGGLGDEMSYIVLRSLAEYPAMQARAALTGTARQLTLARTGEGTNGWLGHTYGIIERHIPAQLKSMRSAQQQRRRFDFTAINTLHVPVALGSMLLAAVLFGHGVWRRRIDDITLLAGTVSLAILGNAFICAVISGPHDRYGARMAWLATSVVLIAAFRHFTGDNPRDRSWPS